MLQLTFYYDRIPATYAPPRHCVSSCNPLCLFYQKNGIMPKLCGSVRYECAMDLRKPRRKRPRLRLRFKGIAKVRYAALHCRDPRHPQRTCSTATTLDWASEDPDSCGRGACDTVNRSSCKCRGKSDACCGVSEANDGARRRDDAE